jgi:hypothetical protein
VRVATSDDELEGAEDAAHPSDVPEQGVQPYSFAAALLLTDRPSSPCAGRARRVHPSRRARACPTLACGTRRTDANPRLPHRL